jgi:hypothetical protein
MIHLVWLGPITKFIQYKIQHFEKMCPNHKIMVYYNDNELLNIYKYTYNKYCKTPYAKSDLIRHSVLQKYGGWYFDFDITLLRPIQDIEQIIDNKKYNFPTIDGWYYNPDFLYCPLGWNGWSTINNYITNFSSKFSITSFANKLLKHVVSNIPNQVNILSNRDLFAFPKDVNYKSLMLREDKPIRKVNGKIIKVHDVEFYNENNENEEGQHEHN